MAEPQRKRKRIRQNIEAIKRKNLAARLNRAKIEALARIERLQLAQSAKDIAIIERLSPDKNGYAVNFLKHRLQLGFAKSLFRDFAPKNQKELDFLKLLENTLKIEQNLWKKEVKIEEGIELFETARAILGKAAALGKKDKAFTNGLRSDSRYFTSAFGQLQASLAAKAVGKVVLDKKKFFWIAKLGDQLLEQSGKNARGEIAFGFKEIGKIAEQALGAGK